MAIDQEYLTRYLTIAYAGGHKPAGAHIYAMDMLVAGQGHIPSWGSVRRWSNRAVSGQESLLVARSDEAFTIGVGVIHTAALCYTG